MIIDNFLDENFAEELVAEFPPMDGMARSNDYMFGDKRQQANIHPDHKDWLRVLNVLLYLNKDWPPGPALDQPGRGQGQDHRQEGRVAR